MSNTIKIDWSRIKLIFTSFDSSFSLLTSILYLTKNIKKEEIFPKAKELLKEIRKLLKSKSLLPREDLYQNFSDIDREDITSSTIYLEELEKTYYYFEKKIRINYTSLSRLYEFSDYIQDIYLKNRKEYLINKNKIISLVKDIEEEINIEKCQQAKELIKKQEIITSNNFLVNLLSPLEQDFVLPISLITQIIKINIIILEKNNNSYIVSDIIQHNENYKFLILLKDNNNYAPVYTKEKKEFTIDDEIIENAFTDYRKQSVIDSKTTLAQLMADIESPSENVKDLVSNLGLEEA